MFLEYGGGRQPILRHLYGRVEGPESVYQYTHDSTQPLPICVKTFGSSFDTVAYVRRGSYAINGGGNEVACNDDCDHDFDGLESIDPDGLCAVTRTQRQLNH